MLSDGERQLTQLALTLAQQTPILLLDEPTSSLSPSMTARVYSYLHCLSRLGHTVIIAAHNINAITPFMDQYIALKNGAVFSAGSALSANTLAALFDTDFDTFYNSERTDSLWRVRNA